MTMKFRAHDTFFIRKGWLSKGMEGASNPDDFINKLYEFVEEFQNRFNSEISSDDIMQLCIKK